MTDFVEGGKLMTEPTEATTTDVAPEATPAPVEQEAANPAEAVKATEPTPEVIPEKYEFAVPDGFTLDNEAVEKFTPIAKELGLSNEKAQKLANLYAEIQKGAADKLMKARADLMDKQYEEVQKHAEFGGANFEKNAGAVRGLIGRFDKDGAATKAFAETGVANNPAIFGLLYRISKVIGEDTTQMGNSAAVAKKSTAELLFDKSLAKGK
jgi:hypothetical protein